jgi:hypothetical protein
MFEPNREVVRGGWRKLHIEKPSPHINRVTKSR